MAADLRRLRNLLEDLEDYMDKCPERDFIDDAFCDRVAKCKAILGGLDVSLQMFRCSPQKPQQPKAIAAAKASINLQRMVFSLLSMVNLRLPNVALALEYTNYSR